MRIAFITFDYNSSFGGSGEYAEKIVDQLIELGFKITVFTFEVHKFKKTIKNQNLEIVVVPLNKLLPFRALQFWFKLPKIIKKYNENEKFDVVHINSISNLFIALPDAPHVLTIHHTIKDAINFNNKGFWYRLFDFSGENNFLLPFIEKRNINYADKIISVSDFTKKQIVKYYGVNPEKIDVVYNGINSTEINLDVESLEKYRCEQFPNKKIVLFVGRVDDYRKGLDLLLNSFSDVLNSIDAVLVVIGRGNRKNAIELCEKLGISNNVIFKGFVKRQTLLKYYKLCDLYVCPSRLEGFGLTLLDAIYAQKPIVASDVGAIPEILDGYKNALLIPNQPKYISESIVTSLKSEKVFKQDLTEFKEKFDWSNSANRIKEIYKKLTK